MNKRKAGYTHNPSTVFSLSSGQKEIAMQNRYP